MIVNHTITMDLTKTDSIPTLQMMQHDQLSRQVVITLLCQGEPFAPEADAGVIIRYLRSDAVSGSYDTMPDGTAAGSISGNVLTLKIAPEVLEAAGTAVVSARLIRQEKILNTFVFLIQTEPAVKTGEGSAEARLCWYLPMPESAAAGQYLKITGVDEQGIVTGLEAADIPEFDTSFCNLGEVYAKKLRVTGRLSADYGIEVTLNGSRLRSLGTPVEDTDAATKAYVDKAVAAALEALTQGADT